MRCGVRGGGFNGALWWESFCTFPSHLKDKPEGAVFSLSIQLHQTGQDKCPPNQNSLMNLATYSHFQCSDLKMATCKTENFRTFHFLSKNCLKSTLRKSLKEFKANTIHNKTK